MIGCNNLTKKESWCVHLLLVALIISGVWFFQNESEAPAALRYLCVGFPLATWASGAVSRTRRVGFFIYGASMVNTPVTQDERIEEVFRRAMKDYPCEEGWRHVYFPSGFQAEAFYMRDELLERYEQQYNADEFAQYKPIFREDPEARYTVDNVLKTLPKINEYEEELDCLCLVSSDYHIERACAIYDMFRKKNLCRYKTYQKITVDHDSKRTLDNNPLELGQKWSGTKWHKNFELSQVERDENPEQTRKILRLDDGVFLNKDWTMKGKCKCDNVHRTKEEEMRCSVRDESNASIFAHYINLVKEDGDLDAVKITEERIVEYLNNNGKKTKEDREDSFKSFKASVKRFETDSQNFW